MVLFGNGKNRLFYFFKENKLVIILWLKYLYGS